MRICSEAAQEIPVLGLLQRFHQRHPVVGNRVLVGIGLKSANSTLTAHPNGHLAYTENSTTSVDVNSSATLPGVSTYGADTPCRQLSRDGGHTKL
jgi:hypothetical protein